MPRRTTCQTHELGADFSVEVCTTWRGSAAKVKLASGQAVSDFVHSLYNIASWDREKYVVVVCDARLQPLASIVAFEGGAASSMVDIPLVLRRVLAVPLASGAFFIHNHPSGVNEPSADDVRLAHQVDEAMRTVGLKAFDHLIVTADAGVWYSSVQGRSR